MGKKEKKKKKGGFRALDLVIIAVAVVVLAVSGYKLAGIFLEYKAGEDAYDALTEQYVVHIEEEPAPPKDAGSKETAADAAVEDVEAEESVPTIPRIRVDYSSLKKINEDYVGWLAVPALQIEYPVVHGADNDYYLHRTFEKDYNSAGSIFMDCGGSPDLTDYNTVIYGHNMRNGSMFGKLRRFGQDETLCRKNPYFYIFLEDKIYQYLIISYYVTTEGSDTYALPMDEAAYEQYKAMALRNTPYKSEIEIPQEGRMVTLSTCYGAAGGVQRFVVHGILVQVLDNE